MPVVETILDGMTDECPADDLRQSFYEMFDDPAHIEGIVGDPLTLIGDVRLNFMTQKFGVEIELDDVTVAKAARLVEEFMSSNASRKGKKYCILDFYDRPWIVEPDSSVPNGFEISSPPLTVGDIQPLLLPLLKQLERLGAKTGNMTGVHIHVGTPGWRLHDFIALLFLYANNAEELALALNIEPTRRRKYCKPIRGFAERMRRRRHTLKEFENAWFTHEEDGKEEQITSKGDPRWRATRYRELNFLRQYDTKIRKSEKTIEFRGFNSTSDGMTLQAYILFILATVAFARALPAPPTLDKNLKKVNKSRFLRNLETMMRWYLLLEDDIYEPAKRTFQKNFKQASAGK